MMTLSAPLIFYSFQDVDDTIVPAEVSDQFKFNAEEPTGKYTF